jgi:hypothetical protein
MEKKRRSSMKKLALGAIAAGALFAATAVPALAQVDVYSGPGGIGVGIGTPGYYDGGPYRGYYNYAPEWRAHPYRHDGRYGYHRDYR